MRLNDEQKQIFRQLLEEPAAPYLSMAEMHDAVKNTAKHLTDAEILDVASMAQHYYNIQAGKRHFQAQLDAFALQEKSLLELLRDA